MIPEFSLIVPTYNEYDNIPVLLERIKKALQGVAWEVVFVDDNSVDGTSDLVRTLAQKDSRIRLLQRVGRRGLSSACIEGILSVSAPWVGVMDADLQHDESILPKMLETLKSEPLDIVIGSRYVEGGGLGEWKQGRAWMSQIATWMGQQIVRAKIKDPMSGFFMMRRESFEELMPRLSGRGFKILLDILSASQNLRFREIPYHFGQRHAGDSKLDTLVIWEYFLLLAEKSIGRYIPVDFLMFVCVGAFGAILHLICLAIFFQQFQFTFIHSQIIATLTAMTLNFSLNNVFTYRQQRLKHKKFIRGLLSFYLVCAIGALTNIQISNYLYEFSFPWWAAGTLGASIGAIWNYTVTSNITWRKTRS